MNGIDAMKDTPAENRIITIRTSRVENFAELSVSDRGSGIPEDKLNEVFEPFFTSKAEGMGMGLSIARTIIEAHNGLISAKNRDHGGATFRIRLPFVGWPKTAAVRQTRGRPYPSEGGAGDPDHRRGAGRADARAWDEANASQTAAGGRAEDRDAWGRQRG